jgi:phage terminase large subunit
MTTAQIKLPPKLVPVFAPARGDLRFRGAYGGRGSGKSFSFALMAAVWGYVEPLRILCTRELQISIKDSMFAELVNAIKSQPWLADAYEIGESYIRGKNGTEFIFKGLRHNISNIKSMALIDLCIIEEAEDMPLHSWIDLEPTIRAEKSEIWIIYNPKRENSVADKICRKEVAPRSMFVNMNWYDNPKFPSVLDEQRKQARLTMDENTYAWIWEGAYLTNSKAQVFAGKMRIQEFEPRPEWSILHGVDFGFSQDPTTANRVYVNDNILYISHEANKVGLELDDTSKFICSKIPDIEKYAIRADSARPESISYLKRNGLPNIMSVKKWPGSVEDGIEHIRSYKEIVVHPRCENTIEEFRLYSYKVDRVTGDVLPDIVDDHNHHIDGIRYALQPLIQQKSIVMAC